MLCSLLLGVLVLGTGLAQDAVEREGYFEVRSATTEIVDGVYTLDARLQLVLSSEALAALESGVTLTIELQLQVIRSRRFMIDDVEAELAVGYELEYLASQPALHRSQHKQWRPGFLRNTLLRAKQPGPRPGIARH